uniref:Transposase MuDR plant domain-containing protein n=1 Tax=Aegilops tauschii subsp. strangulata TaxID=200361 RepID=A0A453BGL2_AEGTS
MEPEGAASERLEPEGVAPEGEEGTELRVVNYKVIVRILRFVAKLDDGSEHQVAQHDVEFEVNMKCFTVEKMTELIGSKIVWGSGQEVHILCKDKHFESVERIDNYWKLLTSFLERWEEKELLVLAQVVDIAKGFTASSCSENIPSSEIVDNIICSSSDVYQSNASSASCVDDSNALRNSERYVQSDGEVVIDWSTLDITPIGDDIIAPMSQENMCEVLGIEDEVEDAQPVNDPTPAVVCHVNEELMAEGAIPVDDQVPEDIEMSYDKDHPKVEKGSIFPTMIDCRRAVRQWAINEEFNFGTHRADKSRWMAHCMAEDCPWKITCRIMADKTKTRVNQIGPAHTCVSSSRLNSAMASQDWVQERSKKILRKAPNIGCKDLQEKLEEDWNVTTGYHTVWKGRGREQRTRYMVLGVVAFVTYSISKQRWNLDPLEALLRSILK